jgi:hypothetical protein
VRHALVCVLELAELGRNYTKAFDVWVFLGTLEERLNANTNTHKGLPCLDVFADRFDIAGIL